MVTGISTKGRLRTITNDIRSNRPDRPETEPRASPNNTAIQNRGQLTTLADHYQSGKRTLTQKMEIPINLPATATRYNFSFNEPKEETNPNPPAMTTPKQSFIPVRHMGGAKQLLPHPSQSTRPQPRNPARCQDYQQP